MALVMEIASLKIITYRAIKTTGTLIVIIVPIKLIVVDLYEKISMTLEVQICSVVYPHWFHRESGSSFFSHYGSGSREPNQCGAGLWILVRLLNHKKLNFYIKIYLKLVIDQEVPYLPALPCNQSCWTRTQNNSTRTSPSLCEI
jgi:hypothetical protein